MNRSPVVVPDNAWMMASVFVERLFGADEQVNLVAECAANRDGKLVPTGYGTTRASAEWVARWTERRVVPQGEAGCWIRLNPTDGTGISDANITAFRVALIEFDEVPLETQLAFFAKIRLPIAALVMSGGKSLHAWVRIGAPDAAEIVNLEIAPAFST
jgi:hypothetical protein